MRMVNGMRRYTRTKSNKHSTAMPLPIASQNTCDIGIAFVSSTRRNIGNDTKK